MEIEFHRLEELYTQHIVCSFKTDRLGIVQVVGTNKSKDGKGSVEDIDMGLSTTQNEPDINVLTESEQAYVEKHMTAALLLTFYPHELAK